MGVPDERRWTMDYLVSVLVWVVLPLAVLHWRQIYNWIEVQKAWRRFYRIEKIRKKWAEEYIRNNT